MKTWQLILVVLAAFLGGTVMDLFEASDVEAQADIPTIVKANKFQLVDSAGAVRAELGTDRGATELKLIGADSTTTALLRIEKDGTTSLRMLDSEATDRVVLGSKADGWGGLAFADIKGVQRTAIGNDKEGSPLLSQNYASGKLANLLTVQGDSEAVLISNGPKGDSLAAFGNSAGRPSLSMQGKGSKDRIKISLKRDGSPTLIMADAKGITRLIAGSDSDGWAGFGVLDKSGQVRSMLFCDKAGETGLTVADSEGHSRIATAVNAKNKASIEVYDGKGKAVFKGPKN